MDFLSKKITAKGARNNAKAATALFVAAKKTLCALCAILCVFAVKPALAQNDVQVTISVLPPYSAYLQDYAGAGKQVQIFVRNTTANRLNVRLQGSVTGDNGVVIQTVPNYRPPVPLSLEPFQNRLLSYADLSGLFDLNQLDIQGVDRANLYKGLPLPEGSYQLCIRAFDNATSRPLSPENPLGCSPPFPIKAVEPPILIAPFCDSDLQPLTPQNIVFTWTPPIGVSPVMVDYTLRIVELPLVTSDPNVFIDAVVLPKSGVEVKGLKTSTFLYSVVQPQLIPGKKYAWRVQARDISGKTNFLNDGKSPVCSFQYGVEQKVISSTGPTYDYVSFITPAAPKGKTLPTVPLGKGKPLYISWQLDPKLALAVAGKLPADAAGQVALLKNLSPAELAKAKQADLSATSLSYKLTLTKLPQGQKKGGVVLSQTVKTPFFTADRKDLPDILEPGRTYRANLDLLGLTTEQRTQYGLPTGAISAEPRNFSLIKQNVGAESDSIVVRGTLAFRYPGESGGPHVMPRTAIMLREIAPNGYEGTIMVGKTDAAGGFRIAVPREFINAVDTLVDKSVSQKGKGDAPNSTTLVYTRYRIVPSNGYLLQPDQTFQLTDKQVGEYQVGTVVALARGYRLNITARMAYKNWPGAPDIKLDGKTLIVFRKPNSYTQKEWLPVEGDVDQLSGSVLGGKTASTAAGASTVAITASTIVGKGTTGATKMSKVATGGLVGGASKIKATGTPKPGVGTSAKATQTIGNSGTIDTNKDLFDANVPGDKPTGSAGSAVEKAARVALKKAGYTFIGAAVLKTDGGAFKTTMERLLYRYVSSDGYGIYCPDCGQTPADADGFSMIAPKEALSPSLTRTESYTFLMQTTEPPTVTFTGKLAYAFAGTSGGYNASSKKPMGNTRVHLQLVYRDKKQTGSTYGTGTYSDPEYPTTELQRLATTVTKADGSFTFDLKLTKPLKLGNLPETAASGKGEFITAATAYQRALRVVVENAYYASPAEAIGDADTLTIKPQKTYDFGAITATVKSYNLLVRMRSDTTGLSQVLTQQAGVRQGLSGLTVYVLRKQRTGAFPLTPYFGPPLDEGQGLNEKKTFPSVDDVNKPFSYSVVAKDKTNADGWVSFPRMVMAKDEADAYLIAVESNVDGLNNYKLESAPKSMLYTEGWRETYSTDATANQKAQSDKLGKTKKGFQQVDCTTNYYVSKPACQGCLNREIMGPMTAEQAQGYTGNYFKENGYIVSTKEESCDQLSGYWIGDQIGAFKTNAKVLLGQYSLVGFADTYKNFTSDSVVRYLKPGQPSVRVRVVDKTNPTQGIAGAKVTLKARTVFGDIVMKEGPTGTDGWFMFETKIATNAYLTISAPGYVFDSYSDKDEGGTPTPASQGVIELGTLNRGQNLYFPRILMQPNTLITGTLLDKDAFDANPTVKPRPSTEAYVQVGNGYYFKTQKGFFTPQQTFTVYAPELYGSGSKSKNDTLKIFPVNISYFNEYKLLKDLPKAKATSVMGVFGLGTFVIDAGEIPIFQRDHRFLFDIRTQQNATLAGAYVRLFGRHEKGFEFGPSESIGSLDVKFKNVSVENLFVEVSRPGYVTKVLSLTNTESKKVQQQTIVYLDEANLITGTVLAKASDGTEKPLQGAEVFVDMGANSQTPISTTSAANGSFTLAIPKGLKNVNVQAIYNEPALVSSGGLNGNSGMVVPSTLNGQPVNVNTASLNVAAGPTYIGTSAKQDLPQAKGQLLKLTLQAYSGFKIATIWGFPVKIEKLKAAGKGQVEVTGEVELGNPAYGPFAIMDPNERVRFEKVLFKASAADATVGEPVETIVVLKTGILDQTGYFEKSYKPGQIPRYNVKLSATDGLTGAFRISRKGNTAFGQVYAKAQLIDNSFNFSENLFSYTKGQFYLFDPTGRRGNNVEVIAFESGGDAVRRTNFGLSREDGKPLEMKLLAFKATSDPDGSRLKGDEIHLNPTLTCFIKDAIPSSISVTVGNLILKNNTIDAKSGDTPLTFKLAGNWSVEVRNWTLDYTKGGFYSTEGMVKTGKVDVPITLFNLRADFFKLEAQPTSTLDLAGIAKLKVGGKAFFAYDAATGSDMKGHWAVVVTPGIGNKEKWAARLDKESGLPGITDNLDFETISLLDNGEDVLTFGNASQSFGFFDNVVQVRPKTIETGKDYFSFDAGISTTIPNAPQDQQVRFTYYRPGGSGPVALKTVMVNEFKIDTKGQIAFNAVRDVSKDGSEKMALYFANGILAMRGYMEEPGKLKLGNTKGGLLLVHSVRPGGTTFITHDRDFNLNDPTSADFGKLVQIPLLKDPALKAKPLALAMGSKSFDRIYASQVVNGSGQWDLLTFSGIPTGFQMVKADETSRLAFTNYGAVKAEGQKIKADGIGGGDGFPGLTLEFDMEKSRFTGTVTLPKGMPIPPTMTVEQGVGQIVIDPAGFYIAASATVNDVPLIIPVTMKAGLMLGFYTSSDFSDAEPLIFQNTHRKSLPCAFSTGFKGAFINGEIPVPLIDNFEFKQNFVIGEVKTGLNAYIDGYVFANYDSGSFKYGAGLGAGVHYYAYGSVLNIAASGAIDVDGSYQYGFGFDIPSKTISMNVDMKLSAEFKATLAVDLGIDSYKTDQTLGFCLGMGLPNVSYTIGGGVNIATPKFTCDFNACVGESCKTVTPAQ